MDKEKAVEMIRIYVKAWVDEDMDVFLSVLHQQAVIRECTGAVIQGKQELEKWFFDWKHSDNNVREWRITSIGYDGETSVAFAEWKFHCLYENKEYAWDGASIVSFQDERIVEINEYEMKRDKYRPYR